MLKNNVFLTVEHGKINGKFLYYIFLYLIFYNVLILNLYLVRITNRLIN